jgi:hypothetical protein
MRSLPKSRSNRARGGGAVLHVKPVPVPVYAHHPNVPHAGVLPQHEFTAGLIAPKGSGKTTLIANLLDFYKGYFHQITVFSPTLHSDEKWEYIRRRPLLGENKALTKFLEKHNLNDNPIVGKPNVVESNTHFDPHIPADMFMTEYTETTLMDMMNEQMQIIEALEKLGGSKHLANRWLIIFDDLVGSTLFGNQRQNPFKRLNTNHRHHSASILMVSQAYKEIPKTVRTQFTCLMCFEVPNESEVRVIYEENPVGLSRERWDQVYKYCTEDDYAFMYINYKRPKRLRIMKNFEHVLFFGE